MSEIVFAKFGPERRQIVWDASSLDAFHRCPRYYQLNVLEGWRSKFGGAATSFGTGLHDSLEVYDRARLDGLSVDAATAVAVAHSLKHGPGLRAASASEKDNARTPEALTRAVVWYAEQFRGDAIKVATLPDGSAAIETRFEVPIAGTQYRFSGRLDKLAWLNDELYIVERKTTAQSLGPWYFNMYSPNTQVSAYVWAARKFFGLPVAGVIIEAFQTLVSGTRIGRSIQTRTQAQMEEFEADMRYYVGQAEAMHDAKYFPMNESGCGSYGGCKFRPVCSQPPSRRAQWLEADFVAKPYQGSQTPPTKEE